ncbi:hypothetical protein GTX14_23535 [Streptomyces sp. SID4944]|nr:hypothetical protein [Streptomyces sp. SID4944]
MADALIRLGVDEGLGLSRGIGLGGGHVRILPRSARFRPSARRTSTGFTAPEGASIK